MKLVITSGKGGTGKTLVATNLATLLAEQEQSVRLLDCDVEAPNDHLFFNFEFYAETPVDLKIPVVDEERCNLCNRCAEVCEFNAIAVFGKSVMVFPELCHACGGCTIACPENAITETDHTTGTIKSGNCDKLFCASGQLDIGEAKAPPVIQQVKEYAEQDAINIMDSPPGTSCPVVETLRDADFVVMVAEDTPFGLHDLKLAEKLVRQMGLPCGLVINKKDPDFPQVKAFAQDMQLPVLAEIPFDRKIAELYSNGKLLITENNFHKELFTHLWDQIKQAYERTSSH